MTLEPHLSLQFYQLAASGHLVELLHHAIYIFVEFICITKLLVSLFYEIHFLWTVANVEVEEGAEVTEERHLASQHDLVVVLAALHHYHFVI